MSVAEMNTDAMWVERGEESRVLVVAAAIIALAAIIIPPMMRAMASIDAVRTSASGTWWGSCGSERPGTDLDVSAAQAPGLHVVCC